MTSEAKTEVDMSLVCRMCTKHEYPYLQGNKCAWTLATKEFTPGNHLPECTELKEER